MPKFFRVFTFKCNAFGVAQAEKRLSKTIARRIEDALPISPSGDQWWVDPIIGLRGQVNFTRWLFLAVQGDVGGFGAASDFSANVSASLGVNFTRNIFLEPDTGSSTRTALLEVLDYNAGEYGLFSGIGVKRDLSSE
jgi:hypothetical protein